MIVALADSVPVAAFGRSLPASFTSAVSAESSLWSANFWTPEKRFLPLRDTIRVFGPAENPGDPFDAVTALDNGRVMPSPHWASHAMTADLSFATVLSAVMTIASPELVVPPNTELAASAPGAAPSVVATAATAPARMVVVRMASLHVGGLGMGATLRAPGRRHIGHLLDVAAAGRPIFRARAP